MEKYEPPKEGYYQTPDGVKKMTEEEYRKKYCNPIEKIKEKEEANDKEKECCPNCGASMKIWKHTLSSGLVDLLRVFARAVVDKKCNDVHLQNDTRMTNNQYNNFQKLRYFGLVAKGDKSGHWVITKNGIEFLNGRLRVHKYIKTFRNRISERSEELVTIEDYKKRTDEHWEKEFDFNIAQGKLIN